MRFRFLRTGLEYVPAGRRERFVTHLAENVVAPGGRLIVGKNNENRGESDIAGSLRSWGWTDVEMSVVWFDVPG